MSSVLEERFNRTFCQLLLKILLKSPFLLCERLDQMQLDIHQRLASIDALNQKQEGDLTQLGEDLSGALSPSCTFAQKSSAAVSAADF